MGDERDFASLESFLKKVPAVEGAIANGKFDDGNWWVKFSIDVKHPLAWHVVQELGYVLNYLSVNERLPTVFKPVSPPPYLNSGLEFLSWVIESTDKIFKPGTAKGWLESRLPCPVDDLTQWKM